MYHILFRCEAYITRPTTGHNTRVNTPAALQRAVEVSRHVHHVRTGPHMTGRPRRARRSVTDGDWVCFHCESAPASTLVRRCRSPAGRWGAAGPAVGRYTRRAVPATTPTIHRLSVVWIRCWGTRYEYSQLVAFRCQMQSVTDDMITMTIFGHNLERGRPESSQLFPLLAYCADHR